MVVVITWHHVPLCTLWDYVINLNICGITIMEKMTPPCIARSPLGGGPIP